MIAIAATEYYLPQQVLTNDDISLEFPEWSAEKIKSKIGVENRHITQKSETALDLAYQACEKLFLSYDRSKIDFILFCTQSPDYLLPSSACILQNQLGLSKQVGALDFNLGCSGFVYGLSLAKGLISIGLANNILLVTSETYTKYLKPSDKSNRTIFGDGAAATVISKDVSKKDFQFSVGSDGSGYHNLIVEAGGARNGHVMQPTLLMDGPKIFKFAVEAVPVLVKENLAKNNLTVADIDLFIFHQANTYMLDYLRDLCHIPEEKFFIDMKNVGNTVSATIPIAIQSAVEQDRLKKGDLVMVVGFGVGYSWAASIIEY